MSSTSNDNNRQEVRVRLSSKIMDELMDRAYSSAYDPFRELVSNSYDANASFVKIERMGRGIYSITDDGEGIADFNRFLTKGISSKATKESEATTSRKPIGEKGLGFLSVFKISNLVEVCSSSNGRTFRVRLTSELIRESIDTGSAIQVEEVEEGVNSQRGTLIRLGGVSKIISSSRLHAYLSTAFAPLLSENEFDVFACGRKCLPPPLPDGTKYTADENSYAALLVEPFRVEDRTPVRFYNGGVIVKSETIPKRPTLTGFVNTDLTLVTGRGGYVEDARYRKFRKDFDSFVETIPLQQYPGDSSVLQERKLQNSLDRISKVLNSSAGFKIPSASLSRSVARSDKPAAKVRIIARTFSGRHEQTRSGPELKEEALSPEDYPVIGSQGNLIIFNVSHPLISRILEMKDERSRELMLLELASHGFADLLQTKSIDEHRQVSDGVLREMLSVWPQS
jgi:hypothetical protein